MPVLAWEKLCIHVKIVCMRIQIKRLTFFFCFLVNGSETLINTSRINYLIATPIYGYGGGGGYTFNIKIISVLYIYIYIGINNFIDMKYSLACTSHRYEILVSNCQFMLYVIFALKDLSMLHFYPHS